MLREALVLADQVPKRMQISSAQVKSQTEDNVSNNQLIQKLSKVAELWRWLRQQQLPGKTNPKPGLLAHRDQNLIDLISNDELIFSCASYFIA